MKVLVDTSVWSLFFRKKGPAKHPTVIALTTILQNDEQIVLIGIIYQEILQAFRQEGTAKKVASYFEPVQFLVLSRADYFDAARLHSKCASKGITASTVDCLIATAAINNDCVLLTADHDLKQMAGLCGLQLI